MKQKKTSRVLYFDVLNICACIAVVFLHHNGIVHSFTNNLAWRESLIVECGFYWAVPVFLMLSGATLLNYRLKYSTKVFFRKRIVRTVVPWIFWSIIMLLWKKSIGAFTFESHSPFYLADLILNNKIESKYWFFGALFACYLAIPVFSLLIDNRKILWYTVILNFVLSSCFPALKLCFGFAWNLDVPVVGSLILYVLLGYLLSTEELSLKQRRLIYVLGIAGFLFRYIYTYMLSVKNGQTDVSLKGYIMFHAVFLSVAVFVWFKNVDWEKYLPKIILGKLSFLSSCSFGIYLIHSIIMYYEKEMLNISVQGHVWRILLVPCTYVISLIVICLIKKIPLIGKYFC